MSDDSGLLKAGQRVRLIAHPRHTGTVLSVHGTLGGMRSDTNYIVKWDNEGYPPSIFSGWELQLITAGKSNKPSKEKK